MGLLTDYTTENSTHPYGSSKPSDDIAKLYANLIGRGYYYYEGQKPYEIYDTGEGGNQHIPGLPNQLIKQTSDSTANAFVIPGQTDLYPDPLFAPGKIRQLKWNTPSESLSGMPLAMKLGVAAITAGWGGTVLGAEEAGAEAAAGMAAEAGQAATDSYLGDVFGSYGAQYGTTAGSQGLVYGSPEYLAAEKALGMTPLVYDSPEFYQAGSELGLTKAQTASLWDTSLGGESAYGSLAKEQLLNELKQRVAKTVLNKLIGSVTGTPNAPQTPQTPQTPTYSIPNYSPISQTTSPTTSPIQNIAQNTVQNLDKTKWLGNTPNLPTPGPIFDPSTLSKLLNYLV